MRRPSVLGLFKGIGIALLFVLASLLLAGGLFAVRVLRRAPVRAVPSTTHASIERRACLECHAPIAEEWRSSYHHKSVTGPYWREVEQMGYVNLFSVIRKPCLNCHAPANLLDLPDAVAADSGGLELGIECTPNLLREPQGVIPSVRADDIELGVDCVSCHVSRHGIKGPGRHSAPEHETIADPRFQDAALASNSLCKTCHRAAVDAWAATTFAAEGVTCLDCHMPFVKAPSVAGGPERMRRSHRFPADKDETMLKHAVNASLEITDDGQARLRIINDRVGHLLPSGANWLVVHLRAHDASGHTLGERKEALGRDEGLLLDFWPLNSDSRIRPGHQRDILLPLPRGHGSVEAILWYHDWMRVKQAVLTLKADY